MHLESTALIVHDQDAAIRFFVDALGFELVEDSPSVTNDGRPKRWVVVRPAGAQTGILLARADGERQVGVIGQQFAWKFQYTEEGNFQTGELVIPVGRETKFTMTSVDVIHSFWVPNFGQKMDAVPGIETTILVTPTRTGDFAVVCAELCGLGHATMRAKARVVTQPEFDKWVAEQKA